MAKFTYLAKTKDGAVKQGVVTASSEDVALSALQSKDLIVISLKDSKSGSVFGKDLEIFNRVSSRDLAIFTRILSVFLEVQIPLVEALSILRDQNKKNKYFNEILEQIVMDVQDGNLLSNAIEKHPKIFSTLYVSIVRAGEVSGGLQSGLLYMADYLEEQYDLNSKIKGALSYPIFVLVVFLVIGLGIAYYVLPQLVDVLESLGSGVELPWTTQIIILLSDIIQQFIWLILGVIILGIGGFYYFLKTETGGKWADKWELKLPVFGQLLTKMYITRFAINLRTLLIAGVPIVTSLDIGAKVVGNNIFEKIIQEAISNIKAGGQLSETLLKHKEFPFIASQIIAVGEKTGKINSVLETIARFY
jgi:type IV pilus assembly protein PilC